MATRNFRRTRSRIGKKTQKRTQKRVYGGATKVVYGRIHANWCGHCKQLQQIWPSVVREINSKTKHYKAVSIEQSEEDKKVPWVNKHFVKTGAPLAVQGGYPTIYKVVDGRVHYYNGPREPKLIAEFVTK